MEMELALAALLRRFPKVSLIDGGEAERHFGGSETMAIGSLPARMR
jgi:hypothetical protein